MNPFADLAARERQGDPIRVGVAGAGFFGAGLVRQLGRVPGVRPALVANRTPERAVAALRAAGVAREDIALTDDAGEAARAIAGGRAVACGDLELTVRVDGLDAAVETTGSLEVGAGLALEAIARGRHILAANIETHVTVGPMLAELAREAGVVYSDLYGDEPALLAELVAYCSGIGLEPLLAANCKGVLKRYATPETQAAFAAENGLRPWLATAAADGTKLNMEMNAVANATGMPPSAPGMRGPSTTPATALADLAACGLWARGPVVDYVLGLGNGVIVVGRGNGDPAVRRELRYLKLGDGPEYLFHHPRVMIHFEAPVSLGEAVIRGRPTIAPRGAPVADTVAFAKRDLAPGDRLDGIGGFATYGLIMRYDDARVRDLLPAAFAKDAHVTRAIARDEPIAWHDVAFEAAAGVAHQLRRRQDERFAGTA